jgi:hypothetical protein
MGTNTFTDANGDLIMTGKKDITSLRAAIDYLRCKWGSNHDGEEGHNQPKGGHRLLE